MNKYYITFGFNHRDTKGNQLDRCYTIIEAEDMGKARDKMLAHPLGQRWAFLYGSAQEAGVEKWGLKHVPFESL